MNWRISLAGLVAIVTLPNVALSQPAYESAWHAVLSLPAATELVVDLYAGSTARGPLLAVTSDSINIKISKGERSIRRGEIRRVRVPGKSRRLLYGVIGAGAGAVGGYFVCPSCANEGAADRQWRNIAVGAAAGSLLSLIPSLRLVYEGPPQ